MDLPYYHEIVIVYLFLKLSQTISSTVNLSDLVIIHLLCIPPNLLKFKFDYI
jgi:hypothetical protein